MANARVCPGPALCSERGHAGDHQGPLHRAAHDAPFQTHRTAGTPAERYLQDFASNVSGVNSRTARTAGVESGARLGMRTLPRCGRVEMADAGRVHAECTGSHHTGVCSYTTANTLMASQLLGLVPDLLPRLRLDE
jgi:hypothetical protein